MLRQPPCSGSTFRRRCEIRRWPREPTAAIPRLRPRPGPPPSMHRESSVRTAPPRGRPGRRHQAHRMPTTVGTPAAALSRTWLTRRRMRPRIRRLPARGRPARILNRRRRRGSRRSSSIPTRRSPTRRRTRSTSLRAATGSGDASEPALEPARSHRRFRPGVLPWLCRLQGAAPAARTTGKSTKLAFDPPSNILMVAFL